MPFTTDESIKQQLLARVRPDTPHRDYFARAIESAFDVSARFETERDRINADRRFTDEGKRGALAALVEDSFVPELVKNAGKVARHAGGRNGSRRAALGRPSFDKTDMTAAMERQELRNFLRSQPEGKRMQTAFELVKDRKAAEAILSGPSQALTGLSGQQFAEVHKLFLSTFFAEEIRGIEAEREDIEAVASAVQIVRTKLLAASGVPELEFAKSWQAHEVKVDAA